jgi:aspartokinase
MQDIESIHQISMLNISKAGFHIIHAETIKCKLQSINIYIKQTKTGHRYHLSCHSKIYSTLKQICK